MMPLANEDAAVLGLPGRTVTVGQAQRAAVDEAPARVVGDEQLTHGLLRAVRRLRRQRRIVEHDRRKGAAVDRDRAGEDEARLMARRAADLEQRARAVQVHAHAEIEVRFRLTADHRREMKNGRRLAFGGALEQLRGR